MALWVGKGNLIEEYKKKYRKSKFIFSRCFFYLKKGNIYPNIKMA